jgi:2-methylcitrate dehydratase
VFFKDGSSTQRIAIDYPIGHPKRRSEGIPLLQRKFAQSVEAHFEETQAAAIKSLADPIEALDGLEVAQLMTLLAV